MNLHSVNINPTVNWNLYVHCEVILYSKRWVPRKHRCVVFVPYQITKLPFMFTVVRIALRPLASVIGQVSLSRNPYKINKTAQVILTTWRWHIRLQRILTLKAHLFPFYLWVFCDVFIDLVLPQLVFFINPIIDDLPLLFVIPNSLPSFCNKQ